MAGVETHARDAVIIGIVTAVAAALFLYQEFGSFQVAGGAALGLFILLFIGAMFPDTDIKSSKPYRWAVKWGTAAGGLLIGYLVLQNWQLYLELLSTWFGGFVPAGIPLSGIALLLVGLVIILLRKAVAEGIDKATGSHRTRTHNPAVLTGIAVFLAGVLWILLPESRLVGQELRPYAAIGIPGAFLAGSLIHIGRDKIS